MTEGPLVAVLDYGIGNLRSAQKALQRMGANATLTADRGLIDEAAGIVLPGVGAFGRCLEALDESGLTDIAREAAVDAAAGGRPFLGICVGMQMLFDGSDEASGSRGLGVIEGRVRRITGDVKCPQMQWNRLGVTTGRYTSTIALGVSGTGTLGDGFYYQNVYDIPNYQAAIDRNEFPIGLAHRLDDTDRLRRDLIQDLRSYFKADKKKYENRTGDSFDDYFATEITNLGDFVENGLVKVDSDRVEITEIGQQFANLIASTFDTYIRD